MYVLNLDKYSSLSMLFPSVNDDSEALHLITSLPIHLKYCLNIIIFVVGLAA